MESHLHVEIWDDKFGANREDETVLEPRVDSYFVTAVGFVAKSIPTQTDNVVNRVPADQYVLDSWDVQVTVHLAKLDQNELSVIDDIG